MSKKELTTEDIDRLLNTEPTAQKRLSAPEPTLPTAAAPDQTAIVRQVLLALAGDEEVVRRIAEAVDRRESEEAGHGS